MTGKNDLWLSDITLDQVMAMFQDNGVTEVLYKVLPQNANSKNQVYLGEKDPSQFAKIPTGEITAHLSVSRKSGKQEAVFHAPMDFYWLTQEGQLSRAPHAKLIFYPQYPEARFSGFLLGSKSAPSTLWVKEKRGTERGRILLFGVGNGTKTIGLTLPPEAPATKEILAGSSEHTTYEAFSILPLAGQQLKDGFLSLMEALCQIHKLRWVRSRRLDKHGECVPCEASNCNGNTLEALLGIRSNGLSKPDYMGWEVKARQVTDLDRPNNTPVTLFTPEPNMGAYVQEGFKEFVLRNGYADKKVPDRLNICGVHRVNGKIPRTNLRIVLDGYDPITQAVTSTEGAVLLLDRNEKIAAGWSFAKLLEHWKAKHAQAAYVPCMKAKDGPLRYRFGSNVLLGTGAEFKLLLQAIHDGKVVYDPGSWLSGIESGAHAWKKRSQFRVSSKNLPDLYKASRIVDACAPS